VAFICYGLGRFEYVENDFGALVKSAARGKTVHWTTFDRALQQSPRELFQPRSRAEILAIIARAASEVSIRVTTGRGHRSHTDYTAEPDGQGGGRGPLVEPAGSDRRLPGEP
jgi:hypothetical protein